jgi:hypothetical protein
MLKNFGTPLEPLNLNPVILAGVSGRNPTGIYNLGGQASPSLSSSLDVRDCTLWTDNAHPKGAIDIVINDTYERRDNK